MTRQTKFRTPSQVNRERMVLSVVTVHFAKWYDWIRRQILYMVRNCAIFSICFLLGTMDLGFRLVYLNRSRKSILMTHSLWWDICAWYIPVRNSRNSSAVLAFWSSCLATVRANWGMQFCGYPNLILKDLYWNSCFAHGNCIKKSLTFSNSEWRLSHFARQFLWKLFP